MSVAYILASAEDTASGPIPSTSHVPRAYSFALGHYDPSYPLTIDPILQSTYLGGSDGDDNAYALAIGANGVYVAGYTSSTDFPGTTGGAQPTGDGSDAFVALLSPDLTTLIQSTYLGGSDGYDYAYALAIGANGVYVAGYTYSTDFPGTTGGAQPTGDGDDAFVALLSPDLTTLIQSTYLGGSDGYDYAYALAIGANGVYVAGILLPPTSPAPQGVPSRQEMATMPLLPSSALTSNPHPVHLPGGKRRL